MSNCQLYNEADSVLVKDVIQMKEELFTSIQSLQQQQQQPSIISPVFEEDEESPIQSIIEEILQQIYTILQPYSSFLTQPLPPYLITYCSKLYNSIE